MPLLRSLVLIAMAVCLISSDAALAAKKKKIKRAPGDIAYSRDGKVGEFPPAVFQHWRHVAQFRCYVCHSDLFEMKQSEGLGEKMHENEMCGSCHRGKPGFVIGLQTCDRCHIRSAKGSDDSKRKKKKKGGGKAAKKEDTE